MPYAISWLIERYVIFSRTIGDIAYEDLKGYNAAIVALLDQGEAPVHVVRDVSQQGDFPFDPIAVRRALTYLGHPKLGLIVAYGTARKSSVFGRLLTSLAGVRMRFVRDHADALSALTAEDARLKALIADDNLTSP